MQAYAEGFEILHASEYPLDLEAVAKAWHARHGHPLVAARAGRARLRAARRGPGRHPRLGRRLRRGPLDGARRRSTSTCPRRSSRSRCWPASRAARRRATRPRCSPRCASSSAATPSRSASGGRPMATRTATATAKARRDADGHAPDAAPATPPTRPTSANPLRAGTAPGAGPRAVHHRHLRRDRRPDPPQDPARALQPAARRACCRPRRASSASARRPLHRRRASASRDARRRARRTRASSRAGAVARLRRGHLLPAGRLRRPRPRTATSPSGWSRSTPQRGTRGNRLFYLATPPSAYEEIVANLGHASASTSSGDRDGWARIVIEKPFGHDLDSARDAQRRADAASSTSRRSTASTTTWARRPSATCWSSASATASSSRSGTGATSTTCRSPWPRTSASRAAAPSTRRPARAATSSRTTCCSCSRLVAMEPPIAFEADALRDEKVRVLRAIDPDWTEARVRAQRRPRPVHRGLGRRQAGARLPRGGRGRARLERSRPSSRCKRRGPELALGRRALLPAHRQAPAAPRDRDRHPVQAAAADALRRERDADPSRTCWRCASSPTRASCCASRPRCPSSASTCAA